MSKMEEMSPDPARDGEPATTEDIRLCFRAMMRDWDEGGILCSMEKLLYEHLYQKRHPKRRFGWSSTGWWTLRSGLSARAGKT